MEQHPRLIECMDSGIIHGGRNEFGILKGALRRRSDRMMA